MAGAPADPEHPFGHGRIEYIAGLIVSLIIIMMGFELFKGSAEKIFQPEAVSFSWLSIGILLLSIAVKGWMCLFNRKLGRMIGSTAMQATAMDSLSDVAATTAVQPSPRQLACCWMGIWAYWWRCSSCIPALARPTIR